MFIKSLLAVIIALLLGTHAFSQDLSRRERKLKEALEAIKTNVDGYHSEERDLNMFYNLQHGKIFFTTAESIADWNTADYWLEVYLNDLHRRKLEVKSTEDGGSITFQVKEEKPPMVLLSNGKKAGGISEFTIHFGGEYGTEDNLKAIKKAFRKAIWKARKKEKRVSLTID